MTKRRNKPINHRGGYKQRLAKRGLSHTPAMESLKHLQDKQKRREKETGSPFPDDPEAI